MLTPQELAEHTFTKAKFGGYTMQEVDEFLDQVTKDYTALMEENRTVKGNLKILADKINEYRETESAIRATLVAAQKTAAEIVAEAENKREAILDALEQDIRARRASYEEEIARCRSQLAAARQQVTEYIAQIQDLTDRQQEFIAQLPDLGQAEPQAIPTPAGDEEISGAEEPAVPQEAPVAPEVKGDTIDTMLAEESEPQTAETAPEAPVEAGPFQMEIPAPEAEPDPSPTARIDFSNLRFGKDYEIK